MPIIVSNNRRDIIKRGNLTGIIGNRKRTELSQSTKAQITTFMIIGIVLLFSSALFFYTKNTLIAYKPISKPLVETVPLEMQPLQKYVTECLKATAEDAVMKIGLGGGYIDPSKKLNYMENIPQSTELVNFRGNLVPLWSLYDDNNRYLDSKRPDLYKKEKGDESMESYLEGYIENNLRSCTKGFVTFRNRYDIIQNNLTADVKINERGVTFNLYYPLEVRAKGSPAVQRVSKFGVNIPTNLKRMYDLASEITNSELNDRFIEVAVLDMLNGLSGLDSGLPPFYDSNVIGRISQTWTTPAIKDEFKSKVLPYVNLIQIGNTATFKDVILDIADPTGFVRNVYSSLVYGNIQKDYTDLEAKMRYEDNDFIFSLNGGKYLIRSKNSVGVDTSNFMAMIIGSTFDEIEVYYSAAFPVIVTINDRNAFNGKGQRFYFALEANILNNEPMLPGRSLLDQMVPTGYEPSINDEKNLVKRTVTVETYDSFTNQAIADADISYNCGNGYEQGKTKIEGGKAILAKKFPFCQLGGFIVAKKQGYMTNAVAYNNDEGTNPITVRIQMWRIVNLNINLMKRGIINLDMLQSDPSPETYQAEATEIDKDDYFVVLEVTRKRGNQFEDEVPLIGTIIYGTPPKGGSSSSGGAGISDFTKDNLNDIAKEQGIDPSQIESIINNQNDMINSREYENARQATAINSVKNIDLVPGEYDITGTLIYTKKVRIPKKIISVCDGIQIDEGGTCIGNKTKVVLPEMSLPGWMVGGENTVGFKVKPEDIYNNQQNITFYMYSGNIPFNYNDLQNIEDVEQALLDYKSYLKPVIG